MTKAKISFLLEDEIRTIHNASLQVLENTGIEVMSERALDILNKAGAGVDYEKNRVTIPRNLVQEALRRAPSIIKYCARNPKYDLVLNKQEPRFVADGNPPFIMDWELGKRRYSTSEDLARCAVVGDYLSHVHFLWTMCTANDMPAPMQGLTEFVICLRNTEKHIEHEALDARNAQYQIEIAAAVAGGREKLRERPIISAIQCPISPLRFDKGITEASIEYAKAGVPVVYMDMPLAMETSPATLAGTLAIINAENLASLVISEFASSGAPAVYSTAACVADPSSGTETESSSASLLNLGSAQIAHYYGLPCEISGSAALYLSLWMAQHSCETVMGVNPSLSSGADIICGWAASPEALVMDNEIIGSVLELAQGFEINEETLAVEVINKVGPGGTFLGEKHTLKHYKELRGPRLNDVNTYETWESMDFKLERAKEKVKEILATHKPEPIPEDVDKEIFKIFNRAEAEFLKKEL